MPWFYLAAANGFYHSDLHADAIPPGAKGIGDELHAQLLQGQADGLCIQPGADGLPVLVPRSALAPTVPQKISRAQGRAALFRAGLWPQVLAYVAAIEDPADQFEADNALNHTTDWERQSPFLKRSAQHLGLTEADMDQLFITASQIVP